MYVEIVIKVNFIVSLRVRCLQEAQGAVACDRAEEASLEGTDPWCWMYSVSCPERRRRMWSRPNLKTIN